jgi:TetR/AcrR family transcriptional repressor of nem operon
MRYSTDHKKKTHRRIVQEAARQFRERGLDAVGVADVMAGVGLTHGGFYAHFTSKEELIAEALRSIQSRVGDRLGSPMGEPTEATVPGTRVIEEMVRRYLSTDHCKRPGAGCVVAALGADAPRHSPETKQELAERAHGLARAFLPYLQGGAGRPAEERAIGVAASLVGGLILARLEAEPAAAERVLAACQRYILDALKANEPPDPVQVSLGNPIVPRGSKSSGEQHD